MKYWKTTIKATIVTAGDKPPDYRDLESAQHDFTYGDASGSWGQSDEELTEDQARKLLLEQGSDPDFLIQPDDFDSEGGGDEFSDAYDAHDESTN